MIDRRRTRLTSDELRAIVHSLPAILSGHVPQYRRIAEGFQLRMAVAFLERVKLAFLRKASGQIGDDGISWPPLSREYLAYSRGPASSRRAGGKSPGTHNGKQNDGYMSADQLAQWKRTFARSMKFLALQMDVAAAKGRAAQIAWAEAKRAGVKTKLEVLGSRPHQILRDRGELFNSLSPGVVVQSADGGADLQNKPEGQVVLHSPGRMAVGTNVAHAEYHHKAKKGNRLRRLWPETLPAPWAAYIAKQAKGGIVAAINILVRAA